MLSTQSSNFAGAKIGSVGYGVEAKIESPIKQQIADLRIQLSAVAEGLNLLRDKISPVLAARAPQIASSGATSGAGIPPSEIEVMLEQCISEAAALNTDVSELRSLVRV